MVVADNVNEEHGEVHWMPSCDDTPALIPALFPKGFVFKPGGLLIVGPNGEVEYEYCGQ